MEAIYYTYILLAAGGILVWYLVISYATRSDRKVKNQEAIIQLLTKLCEKNGVPREELEEIKKGIGWK